MTCLTTVADSLTNPVSFCAGNELVNSNVVNTMTVFFMVSILDLNGFGNSAVFTRKGCSHFQSDQYTNYGFIYQFY